MKPILQHKDRDPHGHLARIRQWQRANTVRCEADAESGDLEIYGPIGDFGDLIDSVTVSGVSRALASFAPGARVNVRINSPGGDAYAGVAIYNLLSMSPNPVTVKVIGIAASAASVIAMAGDRVEMATGSTLMIHRAWTIAIGNTTEMAAASEQLAKMDDSIAAIYEKKSGLGRDEILSLMEPDTYMTAQEAVTRGFADSEVEQVPAAMASAEPTAMSRIFGATRHEAI